MTQLQLGKSYTANQPLNGIGTNPVWHSSNAGVVTVTPGESSPSQTFHAGVTPVALGTAQVQFQCGNAEGNANIENSEDVEVVDGPATAAESMTITETP